MARKPPFLMLLVLGAATAAAAQDGIATQVQPRRMDAYAEAVRFYSANPGAMCMADSLSLSAATLGAEAERLHGLPQLGTSRREASLQASSYRRLGASAAAWGLARFTIGKTRGVRYANCIDYERVAPYVLGDSVGGSLASQRYEFAGGYSRRWNRWSAGAEFSYRAEEAHRSIDPRVRDVASDLTISAGGSWSVSERWSIGLAANLNIYNQDCDLDFYNPINDINTYAYTGMGTRYRRFDGNANKSSGYRSIGYGLTATLAPAHLLGFRAMASYNAYRMHEQLRSYGNLTLGYTSNHLGSLSVAYRIERRSLTVEPQADFRIFSRTGTENIFGSATGTGYVTIGHRSPYSLRALRGRASCLVQMHHGHHMLALRPAVGAEHSREAYSGTPLANETTTIRPALDARYSVLAGKWLLEAAAGGSIAIGDGRSLWAASIAASRQAGRCLAGVGASVGRSSISASITITI